MSEPVCVRPFVGASDNEAIPGLIAACYGEQGVGEERFRHWHFALPGAVQGMVVAEAGGELVGIQPMEVLPHRLAGRRVLAGMLTGVMVHPSWRRQGVFSRLVSACEVRAWEMGAELVWTMPNDRSLPGFLKAGYVDPGERRLLIWSPDPGRLLSRRLPAPLAAVAGWLARPLLGRQRIVDSRCGVQEIDCPGEAEATLAERFATTWPGLVQERSREWLTWRLGGLSPALYRSFLASDVHGQAGAWAVTALEPRDGYQAGYLLDLVSIDGVAGVAAGRAALDALAADGVDLVLTVVSTTFLGRLFRRIGFVQVPPRLAPKRFFTVYRPRPGSGATGLAALGHIDSWYQTLADWDNL